MRRNKKRVILWDLPAVIYDPYGQNPDIYHYFIISTELNADTFDTKKHHIQLLKVMALDYLRQSPVSGLDDVTPVASKPQRSFWKFSKGKFSLLFGSNLLVWVIFAVAILDIDVFSMNRVPLSIPQRLTVTGIVYNEKSPSAIISKQVYGIGDVVDGYTITNITRTEVEFEKNGKTLTRQTQ